MFTGAQGLRQPTAVYEVWSSTKAVQAYQPTSQELSVVQDVCCTQQNWSSAVAVTQWMQPCTVEQRAEAVVRVWTACLPSRSYPDAKVLHRIISMCAASNLQDSLHSGLEVMLCQAHALSVVPLTHLLVRSEAVMATDSRPVCCVNQDGRRHASCVAGL